MLVSTFELLVVPITPVGPPNLARTIVQGYFLTVANTSATNTRLRLTFRATTPNIDLLKTVVIRDVTGTNEFGELVATPGDPAVFNYDFGLPANDTALIILQPDVTIPQILIDKNLEIRGYVEINQRRSILVAGAGDIDVLLTPEHRGTFFSGTATAPGADIDQLVYALPTALGKAQYTLPPAGKPVKELVDVPPLEPVGQLPKQIQDGVGKIPDLPNPKGVAEVPSIPNLREVLVQMAQRVDELSAAAEQGSAFIQADERPAVGTQVLSATGNGR